MLGDTVNARAVCILLECNLVWTWFYVVLHEGEIAYSTAVWSGSSLMRNGGDIRETFHVIKLDKRILSGNLSSLPSTTLLGQGNVFTPVCHSVHMGDIPLGRYPRANTLPTPSETATAANGSHPTGMHSCFSKTSGIIWCLLSCFLFSEL